MKIKNFYYSIRRHVLDLPYDIKAFFQRGKRGWSDRDSWNLNYHFIETQIGMLKNVIENGHAYPNGLTYRKWVNIMKKIVIGFEAKKKQIDEENYYSPKDEDLPENCYEKTTPNKDGSVPIKFTPEATAYFAKCGYDEKLAKKWERQFKKAMELYIKWFDHLWD